MYGVYCENLKEYEEVTAVKATELSPLESDEQKFIDNLYIKLEKSRKTSNIFGIIVFLTVIVFLGLTILLKIISGRIFIMDMLEPVAYLVASIAGFSGISSLIRGERAKSKGYWGFKGKIIEKNMSRYENPLQRGEKYLFERFVTVKVGNNQIVKGVTCSEKTFDSLDFGDDILVLCYKDGTKTGVKR